MEVGILSIVVSWPSPPLIPSWGTEMTDDVKVRKTSSVSWSSFINHLFVSYPKFSLWLIFVISYYYWNLTVKPKLLLLASLLLTLFHDSKTRFDLCLLAAPWRYKPIIYQLIWWLCTNFLLFFVPVLLKSLSEHVVLSSVTFLSSGWNYVWLLS